MRKLSDIGRFLRERYHFGIDLRRWAETAAPLRSHGEPDRRILIANLHYMYGGCKFEALLGLQPQRA